MTAHAPVAEVVHQPPLPNQHFSSWLRGQTTLFISQIVAVLGFVLFVGEECYYLSHLKEQRELLEPLTIKLIVDYAHVAFVTVFILVLIRVLDDNDRGSHRVKLVHERVFGPHDGNYQHQLETSKQQLKMFKRRFLWFWIGMLFLYVFFACQHSYELATHEPEQKAVHVVHDPEFVNYVQTALFFPPEHASESSVPSSGEGAGSEQASPTKQPLDAPDAIKKLSFPFVVFFFNNLTVLFIYWCFLVMDIPSNKMGESYYKHRNASALFMLGLTLLFPLLAMFKLGQLTEEQWNFYSAIFDGLSGVINALVLALLIARLDSKLIGLPSWLISILYSYAAIQPLFMVFELNGSKVMEKIATSVLIFVFISKIYFFLIIIYALQTGKMLNYLFCFPVLRDRTNNIDKELLEGVTTHDHENGHHAPMAQTTEGRVMRLLVRCDQRTSRWVGKRRIAKLRRTISCWLRGNDPLRMSKWLGLATVSYFFGSLIWYLLFLNGHNEKPDSSTSLTLVIDVLQLLVVLWIVVTLYLIRQENRYGGANALMTGRQIYGANLTNRFPPREAQRQLKKFKDYFLYFWTTSFLLYIAFLIDHRHLAFFDLPQSLYLTDAQNIEVMLKVLSLPFIEFLLNTLNLLFIFWCFVVLQSPATNQHEQVKQNLLINYSGFGVALLIAAFPLLLFMVGGPNLSQSNMQEYATVFDGVSGTLSAIVLALLIARMDSKLFRLPNWAVGLLFTYASIQPLFVAFALNMPVLRTVQTSVLTAALGFKVCFFLLIAHTLQSGKALDYLVCFPFLRERVDSIFENQFEIRLSRLESDLFTLSIFKKNVLYYSTESKLRSREDCDRFVRDLRKRMQRRDAYRPSLNGNRVNDAAHEELGIYWVELRGDNGNLLCESISFRSEGEAHHLIHESIEKIPYCKYNRA